MGIRNLLQLVKGAIEEGVKLSDYAGRTIGVDLYSWQIWQRRRIYRYVQTRGQDEMLNARLGDGYVRHCLGRLQKLLGLGVKLLVVLDGARLSLKDAERERRDNERQQRRQQAMRLLEEGDHGRAKQQLARAFHVTPEIAYPVLIALKQNSIPFIVAPYEADAQLAYLSRSNIIDAVLTEDSDLLVFGTKCILYKTDFQAMTADEIHLDNIPKRCERFKGWTHCQFISACIFSGCDYLPNLTGVGLTTAISVLEKFRLQSDVISHLVGKYGEGKVQVDSYRDSFVRAFMAFRFQRVYCPRSDRCVTINVYDPKQSSKEFLEDYHKRFEEKTTQQMPWSNEVLDMFILSELVTRRLDLSFLGREYLREEICSIVTGQVDPCTLLPYRQPIPQNSKPNYNFWHGLKPNINATMSEVGVIKSKPMAPYTQQEELPKQTQQDTFVDLSRGSRFEVRSIASSRSPSPMSQTLCLQPPSTLHQLFKVDALVGKRSVPIRNIYRQ